MLPEDLDSVSLEDLRELVENRVREARTIDYKQGLEISTQGHRKEFLADVTALANTAGGDLLVGVAEQEGEPVALPGIEIRDFDALERQLLSLIRDGTEPRLRGVTVKAVETEANRYVLILRVPRSYGRPHRVVFGGHGHFYARDSSQKYRMDVEELRRAFMVLASQSEVEERFIVERTDLIRSDGGYARLEGTLKAILHLIPEASLVGAPDYDLGDVPWTDLRPLPRAALSFSNGFSLDVVYAYNDWAYTAFFRNGIIEAVERLIEHKRTIFPTPLQTEILEGTRSYLALMAKVGVEFPVRVYLTLVGIEGHSFPVWGVRELVGGPSRLDRDSVRLGAPVLEHAEVDLPRVLRPLFDRLWNAFGHPRCLDYDESGEWNPRERRPLA
jgi:hypothetical protein